MYLLSMLYSDVNRIRSFTQSTSLCLRSAAVYLQQTSCRFALLACLHWLRFTVIFDIKFVILVDIMTDVIERKWCSSAEWYITPVC